MRVIFLDIDGVLNSEAYTLKLEARHRQLGHTVSARPTSETPCDCFKLYHQIDRVAVARLNRLVTTTGAKIVISSSWRKLMAASALARILVEHGLVAEIIGETPDGYDEPEMLTVYGPLERMYRGYEIDFWLRKHPEVDRFVILDDGSDMAMHKNRLVQTDCENGLLDDHVELAIRVLAWDGTSLPSPMDEMETRMFMPAPITSTRARANEAARRDFDGFDVDEELLRLRRALREGRWRVAAELSANIDEHLSRGGFLPVAWLGPDCMQRPDDLEARRHGAQRTHATLSQQAREDVASSYVAVTPAPDQVPGSSWGMHCHERGCVETLTVARTTARPPTHEDDGRNLEPALDMAAVSLGWRTWQSVMWCPTHTVAKLLACAGCLSPCPACSCMGGPFSKAIDGMIIDVTEPKP